VDEIRTKGLALHPAVAADPLALAEIMIEELKRQRVELAAIKSDVEAIKADRALAAGAVLALPEAPVEVEEASYGAMTEKRIRSYVNLHGLDFSETYRRFYDDVDVLDCLSEAELRGVIDSLPLEQARRVYAIACEVCPAPRQGEA
jgi:hypothetical protein